MQVDEATYKRMLPQLQELFDKLPNPGHDEVEAQFAKHGKKGGGAGGRRAATGIGGEGKVLGGKKRSGAMVMTYGDKGTASRFFYCAKASKAERQDSRHPTVKPVALMRWLVRMVTPPDGVVLDPFAGTGTTGEAAVLEGHRAVLIERDDAYVEDIRKRLQKIDVDR